MAENTEFKPPKDMESIYSLFTQDRDKFFKWEKENPDAYFQAILGFVYEDDLSEAKAKYQEYLAAHNKESTG